MKIRFIFFVLMLVGLLFTTGMTAGNNNSQQQPIRVEKTNGITWIKNPSKPAFGQITLELSEDLVVEHGENENDIFGDSPSIALDKAENIYLLDYQQYRIICFDKNGKYRFKFGEKSAGPGGFNDPWDFFVSPNGNIHELDNRIINTFNPLGKPVQQIKLGKQALDFFIDDKNHYIISFYAYDNTTTSKDHVVAYSTSPLKIEKELIRYPLDKVVKQKIGEGLVSYNLFHNYTPTLCFARTMDNRCIFGFSKDYRLNIVDGNGNFLMVIENTETAPEISNKEKQLIEDKIAPDYAKWPKPIFKQALQFPSNRPFFQKILVDDLGRIYVERVMSVLDSANNKNRSYLYNVFSKEGHYIFNAQFPVRPSVIQNGNLYWVGTLSNDDIVIKRYKILNWKSLIPPTQR